MFRLTLVLSQAFSIISFLILTLTLIHPISNWTHWATLRRHPCLSRAATSFSSQVNPIFRRSLLTTLLQFAPVRPLLYPGTCQYSACCVMRRWSIRKTRPSQRSRLSLSMLYVFLIYTVSQQKTCDHILYNNFNIKCPITIIFGIVSKHSRRHRKMVSFPTSPI